MVSLDNGFTSLKLRNNNDPELKTKLNATLNGKTINFMAVIVLVLEMDLASSIAELTCRLLFSETEGFMM